MAVLKIRDGASWTEVPVGITDHGDLNGLADNDHSLYASAAANLTDNAIVRGDGGAKGVQTSTALIGDDGVMSVPGIGDGGLTSYDLRVGNVTTPDYGMIQFGNAVMGRTSYKAGNIDLDGTIMVRNIGGPVTSEIEFIWTESAGNTCRFALPRSGVGNATYNSRSMLLAGPAPADTDFVKVSYWQGQGIFHNLACDTAGDGADLGVQNDLEVEGDIFVDTIKESTSAAGITLVNNVVGDGTAHFAGVVTGTQLTSDIADGTAPLIVTSTTAVANLNADQVDGKHETAFALLAGRSGGQTLYGGTGAGDDLNLFTTSHGTKGLLNFGSGDGYSHGNRTLGIGTAPGSTNAVLVHRAGTAKGNLNILKLVNTVTDADMDGTETSIQVTQLAHSSGAADLFKLVGGTLTDWTSTLGTQDSYFAIHTTEAGVTAERLRLFTDNSGHIHLSLGETAPTSMERFLTSQADTADSRWGNRSNGSAIYRAETHFDAANKNSALQLQRARGTIAVPAILQDDDRIATNGGFGYDGGAFVQRAFIRWQVDGTPASGDMPTELLFYTGDTSAILRMSISPAGDVTIEGGDLIYEGDVLPSGGSSGLVIPSGATPRPAIEGAIFLDSDRTANGSIVCYSNGAWRLVVDLP